MDNQREGAWNDDDEMDGGDEDDNRDQGQHMDRAFPSCGVAAEMNDEDDGMGHEDYQIHRVPVHNCPTVWC